MNGKPWTSDDIDRLFDLRETKKLRWKEIAWLFPGRDAKACSATYSKVRAKRRAEAERPPVLPEPEPVYREGWTDKETERLIQLRECGRRSWADIDRTLCRRPGSSRMKYHTLIAAGEAAVNILVGVHDIRQPVASQKARDDRAARAALNHTTLTAAFFGDPLPGQSALDKKQGNMGAGR